MIKTSLDDKIPIQFTDTWHASEWARTNFVFGSLFHNKLVLLLLLPIKEQPHKLRTGAPVWRWGMVY